MIQPETVANRIRSIDSDRIEFLIEKKEGDAFVMKIYNAALPQCMPRVNGDCQYPNLS
jgi:hypothetical protein